MLPVPEWLWTALAILLGSVIGAALAVWVIAPAIL
jgi:hypothetical protein